MAVLTTVAKKTARTKRMVRSQASTYSQPTTPVEKPLETPQTSILQIINDLTSKVSQIQIEFESLQKEITRIRERWEKEQKDHGAEIEQRNLQEDLERKRQQESYEYEMQRSHKRAEDDFLDQKAAWHKELTVRKEEIERDKKELLELRKQIENFDNQKAEAVRLAEATLKEELTGEFESERKLREQEFKSEKEILNLRIAVLSTENSKQASEISTLKKTLEEATRQLKEIAVRVIDASGATAKTPHQAENSTL